MPFEGAFVFSILEVPEFDGTVFGTAGQLCILRVEGERCDVSAVSLQCVTGGRLRQE
jgi:hypothetical protein